MNLREKKIDVLGVATLRSLCIDGINKAKSGHPGTALGAAPIVYTLYKYYLNANPKNPSWRNRDRFVLSAGHASMLLYAMLHLAQYDVTIDDLKNFRQLDSKTPGHPEIHVTSGVDASSGPLGQGIAEAVGIAMAEAKLRKMYGSEVYDHYTYCLCGDGCLEEGISQEALTYAGFMKLNKLILFYDSNSVTLDGPLAQSDNTDVKDRFLSAGWDVIYVKDGNSVKDIKKAIKIAKESVENPTVIICDTIIGYGSKNQGTSKVHGAPLGEEDGKNTKLSYGFDHEEFFVPEEVKEDLIATFVNRGITKEKEYNERLKEYSLTNKELVEQALALENNDVSSLLVGENLEFKDLKEDSTRKGSQKVLNYFSKMLPNFVGGSADVAASVMTSLDNQVNFTSEHLEGKNINWGIREFLMAAASNGMLLHGGLRTYAGCFLVFSDYLKPAIRMSALMELPQIYLFSHDSLMVGEDGPTHQPIEQLAMLRSIPNTLVFRPCDNKEVFASYKIALESTKSPSCIILSRQNLPILENSSSYEGVKNGAYIVSKEEKEPDIVLIGTGSEVSLCLEAKELLKDELDIRVVSMPCFELFDSTSKEYKESVLTKFYNRRISVEMASTLGWGKYARFNFGIDRFGASGKASDVVKKYHFTANDLKEYILSCVKELKEEN